MVQCDKICQFKVRGCAGRRGWAGVVPVDSCQDVGHAHELQRARQHQRQHRQVRQLPNQNHGARGGGRRRQVLNRVIEVTQPALRPHRELQFKLKVGRRLASDWWDGWSTL